MTTSTAKFKIRADDESAVVIKKAQSNIQNLGRSAAIIQGPLGGVSGRISSIASGLSVMNPGVLASGVAFAGLTVVLKSSLDAGILLEQQTLKLEALLRATGNASGFTAKQLDEMARSLGEATMASANGARDAIGVLLTFRSVSGDTFTRTLKLAQDLSAVMGQDLKSSTLQLAKALEDPTRGLNALRRSGVSFTQSEKDVIVALNDTGQAAEAQALILDKLQQQVGGAGAAEAGGLAGAVDTLGERWTKLKENFGDSSAFTKTTNVLSQLLDNINTDLFPGQERQLGALVQRRERLNELINQEGILSKLFSAEKMVNAKEELSLINEQISLITEKRTLEQKSENAARIAGEQSQEQSRIQNQIDRNNIEIKKKEAEVEKIAIKLTKDRKKEQEALAKSIQTTAASDFKREQSELLRIFEATRTPLENYTRDIERLTELWRQGKIESETYSRAINQSNDTFTNAVAEQRDSVDVAPQWADAWESAGGRFAVGIGDAVATAVLEQKNFGDLARAVARGAVQSVISGLVEIGIRKTAEFALEKSQQAAALTAQAAATSATVASNTAIAASAAPAAAATSIATAGTNIPIALAGIAAVAALSASLFSGARERGGPVQPGRTFLVGERGPELFTPNASGNITPNNQLQRRQSGSGKVEITIAPQFNITGDITRETKRIIRQQSQVIEAMAVRGVRQAMNESGRRANF